MPTVPLGDREEMIHFQHHFTQDDLITLCEWTVPALRALQVGRASTLRGVSYEALHAPPAVCVLIIEYNGKMEEQKFIHGVLSGDFMQVCVTNKSS